MYIFRKNVLGYNEQPNIPKHFPLLLDSYTIKMNFITILSIKVT